MTRQLRSLCGVALVVATLFLLTSTSGFAACTISSILVNSCGPWLGARVHDYPQTSSGLKDQIVYQEGQVGRQYSIVHSYHGVGVVTLSTDELYFINRANTYMLMNWKPAMPWSQGGGGNSTVNAQIDQMANAIKAVAPKKVFLAVAHEPQNDVSANNPGDSCTLSGSGTAGTPADYVNMWSNVRTRFANLSVTNVVWVVIYQGNQSFNCLVPKLWPGNNNVDWLAWDEYDNGSGWDTTTDTITQWYNTNDNPTQHYKSKPWMIGEFGENGSQTQSVAYQYYADAKTELDTAKHPNIKAYVIFDAIGSLYTQVGYAGGTSGTWVADPTEQTKYNLFANDPLFQ